MDPAVCLGLRLRVPRSATRLAPVRHLLARALTVIGVVATCRDDIVLAVSEACSNAVEHAVTVPEYDVVVTVDPAWCKAEVVDGGPGITKPFGDELPGTITERGRGLRLIRKLTDKVELRVVNPHGLAVLMTKRLVWQPGRPAIWTTGAHEQWTVLDERAGQQAAQVPHRVVSKTFNPS